MGGYRDKYSAVACVKATACTRCTNHGEWLDIVFGNCHAGLINRKPKFKLRKCILKKWKKGGKK